MRSVFNQSEIVPAFDGASRRKHKRSAHCIGHKRHRDGREYSRYG